MPGLQHIDNILSQLLHAGITVQITKEVDLDTAHNAHLLQQNDQSTGNRIILARLAQLYPGQHQRKRNKTHTIQTHRTRPHRNHKPTHANKKWINHPATQRPTITLANLQSFILFNTPQAPTRPHLLSLIRNSMVSLTHGILLNLCLPIMLKLLP